MLKAGFSKISFILLNGWSKIMINDFLNYKSNRVAKVTFFIIIITKIELLNIKTELTLNLFI